MSGERDAWLAEDPLPRDPVAIVDRWLSQGFADPALDNPHAGSIQ